MQKLKNMDLNIRGGWKESNNANDWINDNLKGKVFSITESSYNAEKCGEIIEKGERKWGVTGQKDTYKKYNQNGKLIEKNLYEIDRSIYMEEQYIYDNKNNLIKLKTRTINKGVVSTNIINEEEDYEYDEGGKEVSAKYHSDSSLMMKRIHEYNEYGTLLRTKIKSWPRRNTFKLDRNGDFMKSNYWDVEIEIEESYKYDENWNKIKHSKYQKDGTLIEAATYHQGEKKINYNKYRSGELEYKIIYEFNKDSNKIAEYEYDSLGALKSKRKYKYDKNENIIKTQSYNKKGALIYCTLYKYDDKNSLIEETTEFFYEEYNLEQNTSKYSFDEKGNWIKRVVYSNENPIYIIEREYEYFG